MRKWVLRMLGWLPGLSTWSRRRAVDEAMAMAYKRAAQRSTEPDREEREDRPDYIVFKQ